MDAHRPWQTITYALIGCVLCSWAYAELAGMLQRTNFTQLLFFYTLAFVGMGFVFHSKIKWEITLLIGVIIRFIFWNHIPALSQDFYRYLWDGQLYGLGFSPYEFTPKALIERIESPWMQSLYDGMGSLSQQNYSNYPPASQWMFAVAAGLGGSSLASQLGVLRWFLLVGDVLAAVGLRKLLKSYKLPQSAALGYYLNPLLIVEGIGNIHGEGLMLAAAVWGIWFFYQKKWIGSAFFFALSVAIKLMPLIWLPLLLQHLNRKAAMRWVGMGSLFTLIFWGTYLSPIMVKQYLQTLGLWFSTFEFNASWYYLIREWGYQQTGYNIIRKLGKITPWMLSATIALFTFWPRKGNEKRLWHHALGLLSLYYFTTTTLHPWYVIHLVFLATLTPYRYSWLWSFTVVFSYAAYQQEVAVEPPWLVWTEYLPVYAFLFWEIWHYNIRSRLTSVSFK